jgi:hypothetical protein
MPVIVRELVVRANVSENRRDEAGGPASMDQNAREELIKECVDQVMEILKQKTER